MDSPGSYLNPSFGSKYGWITGLPGFKLSMTVSVCKFSPMDRKDP